MNQALPLPRLRDYLANKPRLILHGAMLVSAVLLGLVMVMLEYERAATLTHARDNAENIGLIVERDIARNFQLYDLSIQAVVERVGDPAVMRMAPHYRQLILFDRSASAGKDLGALVYVDEHGRAQADSASEVPRTGDFSGRPWFLAHRGNAALGLHIDKPAASRLLNGRLGITLSRRVNHADGSFAGVVAGTIDLEYFRHLLSGLQLGRHGAMALIQQDGTVVMRLPYRPDWVGRSLRGTANFERFRQRHERSFVGRGVFDGEERLFVYRQFADVPMLVSVVPSLRDIYADWRGQVFNIFLLAALLVLGLLSIAWLLMEEFKRRLQSERDLLLLARQDGLTGLDNRRTLDEALQREWLRARRAGKAVALLFIDIDYFKSYNDAYGHQAGDEALVAVAKAIARCLLRPGDIAARFGGEEFVVILPETGEQGAGAVAEKILHEIRMQGIEHGGSEHGIVTVSIGYVSSEAPGVSSIQDWMSAADGTLYRAKSRGRNQSCARSTLPATESADDMH